MSLDTGLIRLERKRERDLVARWLGSEQPTQDPSLGMEGIVHLRELVQSTQRDKKCSTGNRPEIHVCSTGFLHSSRTDIKTLCSRHGIAYHGDLDATKTTHVLIPLTKRDLRLCQEYAEAILKTDKVMRCWEKGIPVVCLDWLFGLVSDVCGCCRVYNGRAGFDTVVVEEVSWKPKEESCCSTPQVLQGIPFSNDHVSPSQEPQCTGLLASESERTPDIDGLDSDLLRDFSKVRVTPNTESVEHDVSEFTFGLVVGGDSFEHACGGSQYEDRVSQYFEEDTSCSSHVNEAGRVYPQDWFIPGDLLVRFPKGNAVRKRHDIQSRAPGLIQFTYSMVFKHLNNMILDAKAKNVAVEVKRTAVGTTTMLVRPLHFYRILGQDWMLEYRPFEVDENSTCELRLQTSIDACPVACIAGTVVANMLTSKTQKKSRGPPMKTLPLVSATHGNPPYFYRNE